MKPHLLYFSILLLASCSIEEQQQMDEAYLRDLNLYRAEIKEEKRVEFLKITGRYALDTEKQISFGADINNEIIIDTDGFPEHAGTIEISGDSILYMSGEGVKVRDEESKPVQDGILSLDNYGRTSLISTGRFAWRIMVREGNYFLRVRDELNPAVDNFEGYEWFEPDPAFIFDGSFVYFNSVRENVVPSVFDFDETERFIGEVSFSYQGDDYTLAVAEEGFLMFGDKTTGKETYGSGRYLWLTLPEKSGPVVVDFNYAYNPPCIFSKYTTCKFAPPANRLPFAVRAGETSKNANGHPFKDRIL